MNIVDVDGTPLHVAETWLAEPLAVTLRHHGHDSVKVPCGEGSCGGCTVRLDGVAVLACVTPTARATGRVVATARSLAGEGTSARALAQRGAVQCGFCIPGIVAAIPDLLEGIETARERLEPHLCRCTGYSGLVEAIAGRTGEAPRKDGPSKATGEAVYTADSLPAGTLHGRLILAPDAGTVTNVDFSRAMKVDGAILALGPEDDPGRLFHANPHAAPDAPLEHRVFTDAPRFPGDIVGVVVARSGPAAELMAAAVRVEVDLVATVPATPNLGVTVSHRDPTRDCGTATAVFDHSFHYRPGPIAALERIAAFAWWNDGGLVVRGSCQLPTLVPHVLEAALGVPASDVMVESIFLGGSFGLREEVILEPVAALASRACGSPILVETTRAETALLRRRHGSFVRLKTGVDPGGRLVFRNISCDLDGGAYVGHSKPLLEAAASLAVQSYPTPETRFDGTVSLSPTTPASAFRGYGAAEVLTAIDVQLDRIARATDQDPLAFRRSAVARPGALASEALTEVRHLRAVTCLDELALRAGKLPQLERGTGRMRRGRGVALGLAVSSGAIPGAPDSAEARCRRMPDGTVIVETGHVEMGQGTHTALATIAADVLDVPIDDVRVEVPGGARAVADGGTYASRGIYQTANAVLQAARALSSLLRDSDDTHEVEATGTAIADDSGLAAAAQLVEVEVDTWTGLTRVTHVISVHDVGRVIDPPMARGQVVGGVVQAIGIALSENLQVGPGSPLLHQELRRSTTVPAVDVAFVESPDVPGALGAKGLGEAPVVGIPAAILNAIADATGVEIDQVPATPEVVWRAMQSTSARGLPSNRVNRLPPPPSSNSAPIGCGGTATGSPSLG